MGIHVNWKHTLKTSFEFGNIRIRLETESVYWKHNFSLEKNVFFWMTCRQFINRLGNI